MYLCRLENLPGIITSMIRVVKPVCHGHCQCSWLHSGVMFLSSLPAVIEYHCLCECWCCWTSLHEVTAQNLVARSFETRATNIPVSVRKAQNLCNVSGDAWLNCCKEIGYTHWKITWLKYFSTFMLQNCHLIVSISYFVFIIFISLAKVQHERSQAGNMTIKRTYKIFLEYV